MEAAQSCNNDKDFSQACSSPFVFFPFHWFQYFRKYSCQSETKCKWGWITKGKVHPKFPVGLRQDVPRLSRYFVQLQRSKPNGWFAWTVPGPEVAAEALVFLCLQQTHARCTASELLSKELKCCLGLKPKGLHFYTWKYPLPISFSTCLQWLPGQELPLTYEPMSFQGYTDCSAQVFLASHTRAASLENKAV